MRHRFIAALIAAALSLSSMAEAAELHLLNWIDYTAPEVIRRFEAQSGVKVRITTANSNDEIYALLKQRPGTFDLVVPDHYLIKRMADEGMLEQIDGPSLPGFWNLSPTWINAPHDPLNQYSIPYLWGTTSFVVDTSVLPGGDETLATLFTPPPVAQGRVGMLRELNEVFGLAAIYLGLPRCTDRPEDLEKMEALLTGLNSQVSGFISENLVGSIANPRNLIHMAWNGDAMRARQLRPQLAYAYPKEGVLAWLSGIAIPKGAPNRQAALDFITFLLRPEIAALQTEYTGYANPVQGTEAFLKPELQDVPELRVPSSARVEFLISCPLSVTEKYNRILSKIGPSPSH